MAADEQRHVYETLLRAGAALQLRHFGLRALNALRLEKGYGTWGREYSSDYTPDEACLSRFVKVDKGAFVGRDAVLKERTEPLARRLTLLAIDSSDPDPVGGEPIFVNGQPLDEGSRLLLSAIQSATRSVLRICRRISTQSPRRISGSRSCRNGCPRAFCVSLPTIRRASSCGLSADEDHSHSRDPGQYPIPQPRAHGRGNDGTFHSYHHRGANRFRSHRAGRRVLRVCR